MPRCRGAAGAFVVFDQSLPVRCRATVRSRLWLALRNLDHRAPDLGRGFLRPGCRTKMRIFPVDGCPPLNVKSTRLQAGREIERAASTPAASVLHRPAL